MPIATSLTPNPASGTLTPANSNEIDLAATTNLAEDAILQLVVDTSAMQAGDTVVLRVYANAGTANDRLAYPASFSHAQAEPLKLSPPIPVEVGGRFRASLQQPAGTYRSYPWKVLKL